VKLEDIIVIDGYCYIAMELLEGGTLKSYIAERKKLEESKAFFILGRILDGYRILKHHGIIHRDLKPDNIIFQQPPTDILTPKIIDFGYC
jgi:serine/threonine protein kinase